MIDWGNPEWFWAFLLIPVVLGFYVWRWFSRRVATLTVSSTVDMGKLPGNWRVHGHWLGLLLKLGGIALVIVSLARPRLQNVTVERNAEGIDIVMALDISTSMRAEDLKPNRFEAARNVAVDFIEKRESDRIGLVIFARKSFTVCPPTLDYRLTTQLLEGVTIGDIEDGTAIGMGMATAINRLKESEAESKVIILLTDGQNNSGEIDPVTAADLAVTYGIKIYTIGAGTRGTAPYPVQDPIFGKRYQNVKVDIDEDMLTEIANVTGGQYFRATDTQSLEDIYAKIDELERTKVEELVYTDYKDLYVRYLIPAIGLFFLAFVSDRILFRQELD